MTAVAHRQNGSTLIEALVSMALITVGLLGLMGAEIAARRADGQGLRVSQASALAQRVLHSLEVLDWNDPRLADTLDPNDADIADTEGLFGKETVTAVADHQLQVPGVTTAVNANALQTLAGFAASDTLDYNGDGDPDFAVYWNVADCALSASWQFDCGAATPTVKRIGVIVRFHQGGRWYRVGAQTAVFDPSNMGG